MSQSRQDEDSLILEAYVPEVVLPRFKASVAGHAAVIRLDRLAMFKLAEDAGDAALEYLLHLQRPAIRAAAQRLFDNGSYQSRDGSLDILITGRDLQ